MPAGLQDQTWRRFAEAQLRPFLILLRHHSSLYWLKNDSETAVAGNGNAAIKDTENTLRLISGST
jgi:hypothetical protein